MRRLREDAQNEDIASCGDAADALEKMFVRLEACKKWLPKESDW